VNQEQPQIKVGDRVHWTHVGNNKRILSMQRREGVIEEIKGDVALIRRGKRLVEVAVVRLRAMNQKSQVTELVEAVREVIKGK
jgi:hypothetical protein